MWLKLADALGDHWGGKGKGDGWDAITRASFLLEALLMDQEPFGTEISPGQRVAVRKTEGKCLLGLILPVPLRLVPSLPCISIQGDNSLSHTATADR